MLDVAPTDGGSGRVECPELAALQYQIVDVQCYVEWGCRSGATLWVRSAPTFPSGPALGILGGCGGGPSGGD